MSDVEFVQIRFTATGATGTCPADALGHWTAKGYEPVTDTEADPSDGTSAPADGDETTTSTETFSDATKAARGGKNTGR